MADAAARRLGAARPRRGRRAQSARRRGRLFGDECASSRRRSRRRAPQHRRARPFAPTPLHARAGAAGHPGEFIIVVAMTRPGLIPVSTSA
jgi:hypothetical protein